MIIGLVGKPSAGKSTFFKAATLADVAIANYPFTTIEKNEGVGFVRVQCAEKFFNVKCNPRFGYCKDGLRFVPVQIIDVAGLVPDAHLGKGRGNQFLDDLRQADVLIHIVDMSGSLNAQGEPVQTGSYDPTKDIRFLEIELDMWYLQILKKGWDKFARQIKQEHQEIIKALAKQLSGLKVTETHVESSIKELKLNSDPTLWNEENLLLLARSLRKKTKPMIIASNKMDIEVSNQNFARVSKEFPDYIFIATSAESELALREASKTSLIEYVPGSKDFKITGNLNEKQKKALEFIKINVLESFTSTGVQDTLDTAVFKLLEYIAVFPGGLNKLTDQYGNILPDCFLIPKDSTAYDFANKIHSDLAKNFIKALDVKTRKVVGKEHILKNLDVIEIVTSR